MDKFKTIVSFTPIFLSPQSSNDLLNQKHYYNNQESIFENESSTVSELSEDCFGCFKKKLKKMKIYKLKSKVSQKDVDNPK